MITLDDESKDLRDIEFFEPDPSYQEDSAELQKSVEDNRRIAEELGRELAKLLDRYAND